MRVGIVGYGANLPRYRIRVEEIAKVKMHDLNANDMEAAKLQVARTVRSMGITVEGVI